MMATERVDVADIVVGDRLRKGLNSDRVKALSESIAKLGLHFPIAVRFPVLGRNTDGTDDFDFPHLVAGLHRLEAIRQLGWDRVDVEVIEGSEDDARLWEIAENLHRAELTVQERADHIAEWIRLTEEKVQPAQSAPVSNGIHQPGQIAQVNKGGRGKDGKPKEGGISAATRELGIERTEARRAVKIASIDPEAKAAAADAGVKTQAALLKVAAEPTPERQLARIRDEQSKAEAHKANRQTDRVIALTEAQQFAGWLMERAYPQEVPTIITWLEGTKTKDVTAAMRREAA